MSKEDERTPPPGAEGDQPRDAAGAVEDLTHGLDLIMRAARKAVRNIDPRHIEELGQRAKRSLEELDRDKVRDLGRRAAQTLDPKKIEEIANDAGRELLNVVERVAERVDAAVGRGKGRGSEPPASPGAPPEPGAEGDSAPRVRVEE
jgi:hypothetical protein